MARGMLLDGESSMQEGEDIALVEKPKGKKPCRRHRCRWQHNIKLDVEEMGWESELDSFGSEQGIVVSTEINIWVPKKHGIS